MTISTAMQSGQALLDNADSGQLEAEILLMTACGLNREQLWSRPHALLDRQQRQDYLDLIKCRQQGEPIAYLTGTREFWSLPLRISPATLIPRPETELLVERVLDRVPVGASLSIVDLGTGCGAIALAITAERPGCQIVATDISTDALAVAQENIDRLGAEQLTLCQGSWFEPLTECFHIIVSNPPYVAANDPHLQAGDLRFEPGIALRSGEDGLRDIGVIIAGTRSYLTGNGRLLLEHGFDQADAVRELGHRHGLEFVAVYRDLAGHERVTEFATFA